MSNYKRGIICANGVQFCILFARMTIIMEREKEYQLYQIAEDQGGYFSLSQAREIGLRRSQIYREQNRGSFRKADWGVYRFVQFPASRFEELHVAVLRAGQNAVVGFETALYVYDLSDIIPDEIHLILPGTASNGLKNNPI